MLIVYNLWVSPDVMYVTAHEMAQAVGEEDGMQRGFHHSVYTPLQQP